MLGSDFNNKKYLNKLSKNLSRFLCSKVYNPLKLRRPNEA